MVRYKFFVVNGFSSHNAFLDHTAFVDFRVVLAPWCLMVKFPTRGERSVGSVHFEVKNIKPN